MPTPKGHPLVYVVDDDENTRQYLSVLLKFTGCRSRCFQSGMFLMQHVAEMPPDAIVLDMMMPWAGGRAVVDGLRADRRSRGIPIIGITGSSSEYELASADPRFAAVLRKPFTPEELEDVVLRILGRPRRPGLPTV
jgi:CheY-like chemotaxis protein